MADDSSTAVDADSASARPASGPAKEFRIVVRSQDRRGPLGPYRLAIVVAVVAVVFGPALWAGVSAGTPDDGLLIRSAAIGLLVWITTGIVSAALADADVRADTD